MTSKKNNKILKKLVNEICSSKELKYFSVEISKYKKWLKIETTELSVRNGNEILIKNRLVESKIKVEKYNFNTKY